MFPYTDREFVMLLASCLVILGAAAVASGIFLLVVRASGKSVETIASQATKLAQKGIAEEISGLVGNASSLVESLNQLVRTSAGIGIFLILLGFTMLIAAYAMVKFF